MEITKVQRDLAASGRPAVMGRVVDLKGFSTLPVDDLILIDADGTLQGEFLGRPGAATLGAAATALLGREGAELHKVGVEIHGPDVRELGLSCGGRAEVLLQPVASIPARFWSALDARAPVALVTVVDGPAAGPASLAVTPSGEVWGQLDPAVAASTVDELVGAARALMGEGRTARRRTVTPAGEALVESWVPDPRLVVVGSGDIVAAIRSQAGLLGWEVRDTLGSTAGSLDDLLVWAGATGALVVCSHDPHVDAPALAAGLSAGMRYVGAMGSRSTQSRRVARLEAMGITQEKLDLIHRPIGLDLGGRRAPEVALSIVAEILAVHCGRDGRPLHRTDGPIHG